MYTFFGKINKNKLLGTSASLLGTSALLVVTRSTHSEHIDHQMCSFSGSSRSGLTGSIAAHLAAVDVLALKTS